MTFARTAPVRRVRTPRQTRPRAAGSGSSSCCSSPGSAPSPRSRSSACTRACHRACLQRATSPRSRSSRNRSSTTGPARRSWPGSATQRREVVTFEEIPPILLDATTAIEDKTFWENAGFDPVAIISAGLDSLRGNSRGASTITQQLVRARLLPDELVQDPNRTVERKLKEIIQSIRVTQAFPGEAGKQRDHHRLPQPELLRQPELRREGRGESYFGKPLDGASPRPRRRSSPACRSRRRTTTWSATRSSSARRASPRATSARTADLVVPDGHDDRPAPQRRSSTCSPRARTPRSRSDRTRRRDFEAAKDDEVVLASQADAALDRAALRLGRPRRADRAPVRRRRDRPATQLERGGLRVTTTLDLRLQKIAEKWVEAPTLVPHRKDPAAAAKALGFDDYPAVDAQPARTRTSATAPSSRSTTRPASSSPTSASANYYATTQPAGVPAAVRRRRQGLPPARLGVQAVQLRGRHRRRHADRRRRC